jgi:hypothetical protein
MVEAIYEVCRYTLDNLSKDDKEGFNTLRYTLEPYIYHYHIQHHMPVFNKEWVDYLPPRESKNAIVIIERRMHPNFEFILKNIAWACPQLSVYLFCSDVNEPYLRALLGDKAHAYHIQAVFKGLGTMEEGKVEYSRFLTSADTYRMIKAEYMMTIQMDNFIRRKISDCYFIGDYWGNPWAWNDNSPGGGGATIRRISKMIELCEAEGPCRAEEAEDWWFATRILKSGEYPPLMIRGFIFMESIPCENPVCVHQFWTFIHNYINKTREENISFLRTILSLCA